jgi:hypothetical protein
MADSIIKPSAGGTTILQEEGGAAALTIDASGDIQIANSITAGKLGKNVVVPQATTKRISRFSHRHKAIVPPSNAPQNHFMFGFFKPLDPVNYNIWMEACCPSESVGQDWASFGVYFEPMISGSAVNMCGKGIGYGDPNAPSTSSTTYSQFCGVAANTLAAKEYRVWWRTNTQDSQPRFWNPDAETDVRYAVPTECSLVIYEYKNN